MAPKFLLYFFVLQVSGELEPDHRRIMKGGCSTGALQVLEIRLEGRATGNMDAVEASHTFSCSGCHTPRPTGWAGRAGQVPEKIPAATLRYGPFPCTGTWRRSGPAGGPMACRFVAGQSIHGHAWLPGYPGCNQRPQSRSAVCQSITAAVDHLVEHEPCRIHTGFITRGRPVAWKELPFMSAYRLG